MSDNRQLCKDCKWWGEHTQIFNDKLYAYCYEPNVAQRIVAEDDPMMAEDFGCRFYEERNAD